MDENICCIKGCDEPVLAMGLCVNHWRANKKNGSPVCELPLSAANRGLTPEQRFWKSVRKTNGCWLWEACCDKDGYGIFYATINELSLKRAHRFSYVLHTGELIDRYSVVMHSCDNPKCVNPDHLSVGTAKTNSEDMVRKGRNVIGAKRQAIAVSKINDDQVRAILMDQRRYGDIAKEYGIHPQHVLELKARTSRRDVEIDPRLIYRGKRGVAGAARSKTLTDDDVRAIRASVEGPTALSKVYKVSAQTICDIQKRRSWKHV